MAASIDCTAYWNLVLCTYAYALRQKEKQLYHGKQQSPFKTFTNVIFKCLTQHFGTYSLYLCVGCCPSNGFMTQTTSFFHVFWNWFWWSPNKTNTMKMTEELAKHGLFFDYLYNLRVLDPNISSETSDLKDNTGDYTDSKRYFWFESKFLVFNLCSTIELQEFRKIIDEFIGIAETIVSEVEQEKSHAIAAQNLLKSMAKQREAEKQEIQARFLT